MLHEKLAFNKEAIIAENAEFLSSGYLRNFSLDSATENLNVIGVGCKSADLANFFIEKTQQGVIRILCLQKDENGKCSETGDICENKSFPVENPL